MRDFISSYLNAPLTDLKKMTSKPYSRAVGSQGEHPDIELADDRSISVTGYQSYRIESGGVIDAAYKHRSKYLLMRPYLLKMFKGTVVSDIGCSSGVLGLQSLLDGVRFVKFIDHDPEYINLVKEVLEHLAIPNAECMCAKLSDAVKGERESDFEVGFAFAIIHWIYSYSEEFFSLEKAIAGLAILAPRAMFIEWVDPEDRALSDGNHLSQNPDKLRHPYTFENFYGALENNYKYVRKIGDTGSTRSIWLASNDRIKKSLPLLISSRLQLWKLMLRKPAKAV